MNLGERLVKLRKSKNLTQEKFAKEIGIGLASLQRYESGERSPTLDTLEKIANGLNVSLSEVMGEYIDNIIDAVKDGDVVDPLDSFIRTRELKINALPGRIERLTDSGKIKVFDYIEDLDSKYKTNKE